MDTNIIYITNGDRERNRQVVDFINSLGGDIKPEFVVEMATGIRLQLRPNSIDPVKGSYVGCAHPRHFYETDGREMVEDSQVLFVQVEPVPQAEIDVLIDGEFCALSPEQEAAVREVVING